MRVSLKPIALSIGGMCRETAHTTQCYWCFGGFGFVVLVCFVECGLLFFDFVLIGCVWCLVGACFVGLCLVVGVPGFLPSIEVALTL